MAAPIHIVPAGYFFFGKGGGHAFVPSQWFRCRSRWSHSAGSKNLTKDSTVKTWISTSPMVSYGTCETMDNFAGQPALVLIAASALVGILTWTARLLIQAFVSHPLAHFPGPRLSALSNVCINRTFDLPSVRVLAVDSHVAKLFVVLHGWPATIRYSRLARKIR